MKKLGLTGKERRVRQMLGWMPVVMVPIVTILFWVVGGGRGRAAALEITGFLKRLPAPYVDPLTRLDKMGYYELARRDSVAGRQRLGIEKSYAKQLGLETGDAGLGTMGGGSGATGAGLAARGDGLATKVDENVVRVREKLEELRRVVDSRVKVVPPGRGETLSRRDDVLALPVTGRLERDEGGNVEIRELSKVVEKLLVLQRGKEAPVRSAEVVHSVEGGRMRDVMATELKALPVEGDSVFGFDSSRIEAIVAEEQVLVSGGELRLELATDVQIGRQRVPAGTALFGTVGLSGERMRVEIGAVAVDGRLLPVRLEASDEDGMVGIYVPGAPMSEALRESAGQEMGALGSGLVSTSVAGQAAGAGVVLARSLIGKRVRPVRVTIPAGYRVLLHVKNVGL